MRRSIAALLTIAAVTGPADAAESAYPFIVSEEPRTPTPVEVQRALRGWLECYECTQGELRRVVALGVAVIADLQTFVDTIDPVLREQIAGRFSLLYDDLQDHASRTGASLSISKTDYVKLKVDQFFELRKLRAEQAIAAIATHATP